MQQQLSIEQMSGSNGSVICASIIDFHGLRNAHVQQMESTMYNVYYSDERMLDFHM